MAIEAAGNIKPNEFLHFFNDVLDEHTIGVKFCDLANTITYKCGNCGKEFTNHEAKPLTKGELEMINE